MNTRTIGPFVAVTIAALTVAGCSSGSATESSSTPVETTSIAEQPGTTPDVTPSSEGTATSAPSGPPEECVEYAGTQDTEGDPIAAAAALTVLPPDLVLMGTQVITNSDAEGMFDAVVRICSDDLSSDEVEGIGHDVTAAILASDAGPTLATIRVTLWIPDGAGSVTESVKIRNENVQAAPDSWEVQGVDY